MQALVLNDDRDAQVATAMALFKRNFQVVTAETVEHARAYVDLGVFDLVVMAERVQGRLSHPVALSAELRNPDVTTMLLTPRTDADVDELYDLLPSLYCLLGTELPPETVARMAVAGVVGSLSVSDRKTPASAGAAAAMAAVEARELADLEAAAAERGDADWCDEDWSDEDGADGDRVDASDAAAALPEVALQENTPTMAALIARATASLGQGDRAGGTAPWSPTRDGAAAKPARETAAA